MFSNAVGTLYENMAIAVPHASSPYVSVYNVSPAFAGTNTQKFTKLANPTVLPTTGANQGTGAQFSPNGDILAICVSASPYVRFYERQGNTFQKLTDPVAASGFPGRGGAWHPDGNMFVAGHSTFPYIFVGQRSTTTSTTFVKANTATIFFNDLMPTGNCRSASWNPQGNILTIGQDTTPFIRNYWWDGEKFYRLNNPDTLPTGYSDCGATWSNDGSILFFFHNTSPRVSNYYVNYNGTNTTFTKLANPASLPTGNLSYSCAINNTGSSIAISPSLSPYLEVYNISYNGTSTTLTKISPGPTAPANAAFGMDWLYDDNSFVYHHYNTPRFYWYTRSDDTFTRQGTQPDTVVPNSCVGPSSIYPKRGPLVR